MKKVFTIIVAIFFLTSGLSAQTKQKDVVKIADLTWHSHLQGALAEAKTSGKNILIYFTGYTCANCRAMETSLMKMPEVQSLCTDIVRAALYTDDDSPPNDSNRVMEGAKFGTIALPFYAVISPQQVKLATFQGSAFDVNDFISFLSPYTGKISDNKKEGIDPLQWQFPIRKFWDEALVAAQKSRRPVMVFNVDYADPNSISVRDKLLKDKAVMNFLSKNFELAVNDFSIDPPPEVGYDSLSKLGARLDGLEKGYNIVSRPTAILLNPDRSEIDRISDLQNYESARFIQVVKEYLAGKNTINVLAYEFWKNPKDLDRHKLYLDRLMERFDYDSILYHLTLLSTDPNFGQTPEVMKEAKAQYAYLRFKQEGNVEVLKNWLLSLDPVNESALVSAGLKDLLEYYQSKKKIDSIAVSYERIFAFEKERDADMLNNYAWDIANFSTRYDSAMSIVNEAIAKNSKNPNYYDTRSLINFNRKEYDTAIADARLALKYSAKDDKKYFKERIEYYEKAKKQILSEEKSKQ